MNDELLIADYYACNNESMAELIQRHNDGLVRWFMSRGLTLAEAEDCAQEVWLRVMNTKHHLWGSTAGRFDPSLGVPFAAWLYQNAHWRLSDALAQHGATTQVPVNDEGEVDEDVFTDPGLPVDEDMIADEAREAVRACMDELPPRQRIVLALELVRTEQANPPQQRDWAAQHGMTPGAYIQLLTRARQAMRECLERRLNG
jgi:RNA polymerase sigma factor (sigma-70 family)